VGLSELDGERLLTWSARGTPFTDMLVATLAAAGARVTTVEARITGSPSLAELREAEAVALVPVGWPETPGTARVPLAGDVRLPLIALWRSGPAPAAARRLVAAMGADRETGSRSGERRRWRSRTA
jgi:hypothetical protein